MIFFEHVEFENTSHSVTLVPRLNYSINLLDNIIKILQEKKFELKNLNQYLVTDFDVDDQSHLKNIKLEHTALLVFSILAPSFVELISDIEIVEIADINDKEIKEKLEKDIEEKIIQHTELEENLDFSNKNNNSNFYYLKKHTNVLFDVISPPPEITA